jgi:holliday junction DNA helicase RuvA
VIGSLRGTLLDRSTAASGAAEALVEVAGVGYRVTVTPATLAGLGEVGAAVFLFTHHLVREDAQELIGFPSRGERDAFELLLGAHGVGRSLALAILSVHPPTALRTIVAESDLKALCLVPGVGKKTAERLLLELRNRLDVAGGAIDIPAPGSSMGAMASVREALSGLGYGPEEVRDATADLSGDDASALLKRALQKLAVSRG